ncbi:MAG: tRNA (adenosine(37)-N6)-threonylcarbamoyltransferase complex ATPase subunit type 1 TsaE [Evtepia gabavorous]
MERYSASEQETEAIGREMAQRLAPGAVVAFTGDLGAGKTAFVRGMAQGLGISQRVTSPTFTIVNEYEGGTLPLFHFDHVPAAATPEDLFDIGWEDYLPPGRRLRGGVEREPWPGGAGGPDPSAWTSAGGRRRTSGDSHHPETRRSGDRPKTDFRKIGSKLQEKCVMKP